MMMLPTSASVFAEPVFPRLYNLQVPVWETVAAGTLTYLIDTDTENYRRVMRSTYKNVLINIFTCFALGNILVFLFWRIRRKIYSVYSILDRVMPFEVQLAQDLLARTDSFIDLGSKDQYSSRELIVQSLRSSDAAYAQYR